MCPLELQDNNILLKYLRDRRELAARSCASSIRTYHNARRLKRSLSEQTVFDDVMVR